LRRDSRSKRFFNPITATSKGVEGIAKPWGVVILGL